MNITTVVIVFAVWVPLVVALFRIVGPRKAVAVALFGAFLLLPREADPLSIFGLLSINKRSLTGLAILAGILVFDHRTLIRSRPRWVDAPMIAFVFLPFVSLAVNEIGGYRSTIDQVWRNFAEWSLPYLAGRLYFGDREAPRFLSMAVVVTGLLSIPIYVFEMIFGPDHYLAGMLYGIKPIQQMVSRLGGWRPEGFQSGGVEAASWIAMAATMSIWVWLKGGWTIRRVPGWAPPIALVLTAIGCRGVYGYLDLAVGLVALASLQLVKSRFVLIVLAILPMAYMGMRSTGLWDGRALVEMARVTGRPDTVEYRLFAEDSYLKKVRDHDILLGFGGSDSSIFHYYAQAYLESDGWWIRQIKTGGVVGLADFLLALFLVPAMLTMALPGGRSRGASPGLLSWGLALYLLLHCFDCLHNTCYLAPTPLIGGSLVSLFLARKQIRPDVPYLAPKPSEGMGSSQAPLMITVVVLVLIEILGRLPRTTAIHPSPTALESPAAKGP